MPPALRVTFRPAAKVTRPEPLVTLVPRRMSLVAPVAVKVTVPAPAADVTAVEVVIEPVLFVTLTLPPPVSLMPVTVRPPAAASTRVTLPLLLFVALKLVTVFTFPSTVPAAEEVVNSAPLMQPRSKLLL